MSLFTCSGIQKSFGNLSVLKNVNLEVKTEELVSILGKSGTGKSTLLHILGTLQKPDKGKIFLKGKPITKLSGKQLAKIRNTELGFVFQFHNLLPEFNTVENICLPGWISGRDRSIVLKEAEKLIDFLDLKNRKNHRPATLSGGEQQRVAVARALVNRPSLVLADEPTGNLDKENAQQMHRLFLELRKEWNTSFIIITHNQNLADLADTCYTLEKGILYKKGDAL